MDDVRLAVSRCLPAKLLLSHQMTATGTVVEQKKADMQPCHQAATQQNEAAADLSDSATRSKRGSVSRRGKASSKCFRGPVNSAIGCEGSKGLSFCKQHLSDQTAEKFPETLCVAMMGHAAQAR